MDGTNERAILAGGCFWGMQDLIRSFPGVIKTRVGYTGGKVANATYRNHAGHAEAIEIIFDPQQLTYRRLLEFFFRYTILRRPIVRETTSGQLPFGDLLHD
jgi:peptide-methionine (S)-S-oxide reductase